MPSPTNSQLEPIVKALMQQNNIKGEYAPALASAIAELVAESLNKFMKQAKVSPGIASPPGVTVSPGRLI